MGFASCERSLQHWSLIKTCAEVSANGIDRDGRLARFTRVYLLLNRLYVFCRSNPSVALCPLGVPGLTLGYIVVMTEIANDRRSLDRKSTRLNSSHSQI